MSTTVKKEHTPGPWKYDANGDGRILASNPPLCLALITGGLDDGVECGPTSDANARLIAAAPDLLEACKNVRRFVKAAAVASHFLEGFGPKAVTAEDLDLADLEAAIEKAEGRCDEA